MAFSLRNLLKKLQGGVEAIRKPLPPPVVIQPTAQQLKSPRVQQSYKQSQPYIQSAQQQYINAQPLNVIRNAPAELPRLNFADKYKNPVSKFVATIPQEILNAPRDVFAGSLGLGANVADVAYGRKPVNPLRNIGTIGAGFVNAYAPGPAKQLATQAGKAGLRGLVKQGAIQGAKLGALGGAAYGLQEGDNAKQQLKNAVKQGAIGAAVGGIAGGAIPAVSQVWKKGKISAGMSVKNVGDTPLHQEARKYKSAEEFVKAQPRKIYHVTNADNKDIILREGFKKGSELPEEAFRGGGYGSMQDSVSFAETPKDAARFGISQRNTLVEVELNPKSKVINRPDIEYAEDLNDEIPSLLKQGIDAVIPASGEGEIIIINPKAIQKITDTFDFKGVEGKDIDKLFKSKSVTKSQLTDIYNQATTGKAQNLTEGQLPSSNTKPNQLPQPDIGANVPPIPPVETSSLQGVPQGESAVNKIIKALKEAKPIRGEQERLYSAERSKRVGRLAGTQKNLQPGEQGYYQQLGQLKGELPKAQFESIRGKITQEDVNELFSTVRNATITPFEKISAETGLMKLISPDGGQVPTKGELALLQEIFPPEFIKAIETNKGLFSKLYAGVLDIANIPRSIMTSVDLSAPFRQGVFNIGRKEFWKNIPAMFKYAVSEKSYQKALGEIKTRPNYLKMREAKLALTDLGTTLDAREEKYMSNLVERVPGFGEIIRGSGRAYTGFLTKLRADMFDNLYNKSKQLGVDKEAISSLGKFINAATGRGNLAGNLNRVSRELNAVFFSPRLLASRLNLMNPQFYYKLDPFVRKEALKSLASFLGVSSGILSLAHMAGAEVVMDPRNSDFAKIKIGNTRYDILGGFQQPFRTAAQLLTGEHISSTTGRLTTVGEGYKPLTRTEILLRFFKSKEAPVVSLISSIWDGTNFLGQPVNLPSEIASRLIPMVIQDAYELYKETGDEGVIMAIPALFGVSAQTYGTNEPTLNVTPSGKVNVKATPVTGLAEDITNKFFPEKPKAQDEIKETIELLKAGTIDKESAKERIRQSMLKDAALKVNSDPEKKKALSPLLVEELKKTLKSDIKSVTKDYTLTKEEKKKQLRILIDNFKKAAGSQARQSQASTGRTAVNILPSLGPITGINGSSLWKPGLDIDLVKGQPVPAAVGGQVIASARNGGFGNQVKILGDDGREYWYSHLDKRIAPGQRVNAGQIIGLGGNTGNVIPGRGNDGSHLDLTVVDENGRYIPARSVAQLLKTYS